MGLNAEGIFDAALRVIDAEGLDALTMRRLASDLGVAPMSLYGHVATKEHVLLGVVNMVTREIRLPDPASPPWDALRSVVKDFRRNSLQHPNLVPLIMRQPPTGSEGLLTLEAALDALRRAGLPPALAARAYRLTSSWAIGFVSLECGGYFKPIDVRAGDDVAPIDLSVLPRVAEVGPFLASWQADEEFDRGMDMLIEMIAGWVDSDGTSESGEGNGGGSGHVERIDAPVHRDPHPAVGGA